MSGWTKAAEVGPFDTRCHIPDLVPNDDYEFRVIALNAAGKSDPSLATAPVTVKEKVCEFLTLKFSNN